MKARTVRLPKPQFPATHTASEWFTAGTYNASETRFEIVEIPAPPEARMLVAHDFYERRDRMAYEMALACPHCKRNVEFVFGRSYEDAASREMEHDHAMERAYRIAAENRERLMQQIVDRYDPDAGAETYMPEGVP